MAQPTRRHRIKVKPGAIYGYCKRHDISRDELARRLGVSTGTAYRVDDGRVDPSPAFIAAFMTLTGEPFDALFIIERPESEVAA